jgi:hypothetical protein
MTDHLNDSVGGGNKMNLDNLDAEKQKKPTSSF